MASSLLVRADSEVLGLAVLLVRAVLTVLVVVAPPAARDTFPCTAPANTTLQIPAQSYIYDLIIYL